MWQILTTTLRRRLAIGLLAGVLAVSALPGQRPAPAEAAGRSIGWLHTAGAQILTASNQPYTIKAVSWFGMETSNCAPHGLWQIRLDDGLAQIASFGFNTIRLPFSNECLHTAATTSIDATLNPDLVGLSPLQLMDAFVARAEAHGLSVLLDRHRPDSGAQSELWYTAAFPESAWLADWTMLARRYADNPTVIGADLHNEPHGAACWGCGDATRDWRAAAVRGGNAVLAANPRLLVVVEGVEIQGNGAKTWWGGGLSDAAQAPVTLNVSHRLVYCAHDYPASIYPQPWFSASDYPRNLPAVWDRTWGYLQRSGAAPVLLGEFGTTLRTTSDRQWLDTLVGYLRSTGISFAYWSFNPNSGDTGGLVQDDWVTPQTAKLDALAPLIGTRTSFTPGHVRTTRQPPAPAATPRAPAPPPATARQRSTPPAPAPTPSNTPSPSRSTTTGASGPSPVEVRWLLQSSWADGYVTELAVSAPRGTRASWSVHWDDPAAVAVSNAWGMTCTVTGGGITCTGHDWARSIPAGGSARVGVQIRTTGAAPGSPALVVF